MYIHIIALKKSVLSTNNKMHKAVLQCQISVPWSKYRVFPHTTPLSAALLVQSDAVVYFSSTPGSLGMDTEMLKNVKFQFYCNKSITMLMGSVRLKSRFEFYCKKPIIILIAY